MTRAGLYFAPGRHIGGVTFPNTSGSVRHYQEGGMSSSVVGIIVITILPEESMFIFYLLTEVIVVDASFNSVSPRLPVAKAVIRVCQISYNDHDECLIRPESIDILQRRHKLDYISKMLGEWLWNFSVSWFNAMIVLVNKKWLTNVSFYDISCFLMHKWHNC